MMHGDDRRWYHYKKNETWQKAGHYAWKMKDCNRLGFELRHGARKKRVVYGVLVSPPSGALSIHPTPIQLNFKI
jgi:hypothetical protein